MILRTIELFLDCVFLIYHSNGWVLQVTEGHSVGELKRDRAMKKRHRLAISFILLCSATSSAIVVQDYSAAEAAPPGFNYWNYVYNYKGSSGVAVGGSWLLTAAHVADDGAPSSLTIDGITYTEQQIIPHNGDADLALIRYDKPFPEWYALYSGSLVPDLEVRMVGFGTTGSVFANSWTDSGGGKDVRRWGSQLISGLQPKRTYTVWNTESMRLEFDLTGANATAYEAGAGTGDSGGGVFYNDGGTYKLAGIMISRTDGSLISTFAASMPEYSNWIASTIPNYADWAADAIPEPQTLALMSLSTLSLCFIRRRRRRKLGGRTVLPITRVYACDIFDNHKDSESRWCLVQQDEEQKTLWLHAIRIFVASGSHAVEQYRQRINDAILDSLSAAYERCAEKKQQIDASLEVTLIRRVDAFLDRVHWDRVVHTHSIRKDKVNSALKRKAISRLDTFLEAVQWDRAVSAYRARKRAVSALFRCKDS